ncbi:MAG: imidazolonepropionase [Gemmatimonadaceae bacterium]
MTGAVTSTDVGKLFVNASQVITCAGPSRARRGAEMSVIGIRRDACVAVHDGKFAAIGTETELAAAFPRSERIDCTGRVLTPGLIDSHTHAVFGRARYEEQEMRSAGSSYMEIAQRGGGIHSSVRDLRARSADELVSLTRERLARIASYGTTTIEIKSGYGLSVEDELKSLRVIARLQRETNLRLVPTWLGAHEIPLEYRERAGGRAAYVELLINEMLPRVVSGGLARFADVFCEPGVFTINETRTILQAAAAAGLATKLHADELEPCGGAELAVSLGATSADHLAAVSAAGIRALARADTVATLLPGTMFFLGRTKQAPARELIASGAAVALATDFNPGTSPTVNLPLVMTIGVSQLCMSVAEVITATTANGAAALAIAHETGQISPGFAADLALWDCGDVREIPYWYGDRRCVATWAGGEAVRV